MKLKPIILCFIVLSKIFLFTSTSYSTDVSHDEAAVEILKTMCEFLKSSPQYKYIVKISYEEHDITTEDKLFMIEREAIVHLKKPKKFYGIISEGDVEKMVFYDGKTFSLVDAEQALYGKIKTKGTIRETLDLLTSEYGFSFPLSDFIFNNLYDNFMQYVQVAAYFGIDNVNDTECHRISFIQENINWQIWIDAGAQPVPKKIEIIYKDEQNEPVFKAVFSEWNFDELNDKLFEFKSAKGFQETEFLPVELYDESTQTSNKEMEE